MRKKTKKKHKLMFGSYALRKSEKQDLKSEGFEKNKMGKKPIMGKKRRREYSC